MYMDHPSPGSVQGDYTPLHELAIDSMVLFHYTNIYR